MSDYYFTAQICINGHVVTDSADKFPQHQQKYCSRCGASTIMECPSCSVAIRGNYHCDGIVSLSSIKKAPAYCYNCGTPYPWTKAALEATSALILEDDSLSALEQEKLSSSLVDIIAETPRTTLATTRFKKAFLAAGRFTAEALRQFAIDFGCELAKSQLGIK